MAEIEIAWVAAFAAVAAVIVAVVGFLWNYLSLNEMNKTRNAAAIPILEFGATHNPKKVYFVVKNVGNGVACNLKLNVIFEGYELQKGLDDSGINIAPMDQRNWEIDMIPEYLNEHGLSVITKIKVEFEDVYEKKFKNTIEQKLSSNIFSLK